MNNIPSIKFKKSVEFGFEVIKLDKILTKTYKNHSPLNPHKVNFYMFIIITKGEGKHYIDFKYYEYSEGDFIIISKNQVHAFGNSETDGYAILFTEEFLFENMLHIDTPFLDRLYNYQKYSPILKNINNSIKNTIFMIIDEFNSVDSFGRKESLRVLLQYLLIKIIESSENIDLISKNSSWIRVFSEYLMKIGENYKKTKNVIDYADMLGVTYKHINVICKDIANKTAKEILDDFVILEIKRYISLNDVTGDELTVEFGFDETTNLSKYFKKHTKLTPNQFKKICQK